MKPVDNRKNFAWLMGLSASALLSACGTLNSTFDGDRIDYKTEGANKGPSLSVPPDLTKAAAGDRRYTIPAGGVTTLSGYLQGQQGSQANAVIPQISGMQIQRQGAMRWLTVNKPPTEIWGTLRDFWQEMGFVLETESPETGILETDWAENRANIPQDIVRTTIGKVFDGAYSTAERDKFRTRLERNPDGGTDIYVTHRGVKEELVGQSKDRTIWTGRPASPELEAEFLARIMTRLGMKKDQARATVNSPAKAQSATPEKPASRVTTVGNASRIELNEPFDRAWRQVGFGLDRLNFTVEDRDRAKGAYLIRYVDPKNLDKQPGFFDRLFSGTSIDDLKKAKRYAVTVKSEDNRSFVFVLDEKNSADSGEIGKRILNLLDEQMR